MKENHNLAMPLEPTIEKHSRGKIAGIRLCRAYRRQDGCCWIGAIPRNKCGRNEDFGTSDREHAPATGLSDNWVERISG